MGAWARSASADPVSGSRRATYATFVNPNARCPECRAQVFFYQSDNGGRVFFDELGPPWPMHGCTSRVRPKVVNPGEAVALAVYAWQDAGWSPLLTSSLASVTPALMRLSGYIADDYENFYVPKAALPRSFDQRSAALRVRSATFERFERGSTKWHGCCQIRRVLRLLYMCRTLKRSRTQIACPRD